MADSSPVREMALPGNVLVTLRRSLRGEAGPLPTVHALHAAGYKAGEAMSVPLLHSLGDDPDSVGRKAFWTRFSQFWSRRGWGELEHRDVHSGIGLLVSSDWAEASEDTQESQPSCAFTAGLLASVLGRVAGGPLAVLEIRCRSRGDGECAFVFGSEAVVHDLYGTLLDGVAFDDALAAL